MNDFNGLGLGPHTLSWLSDAQSRSISAENPTGEKGHGGTATEGTGAGAARDLGRGWKVSPSLSVPAGQTVTLADIAGPGALQSFWFGGYVGRDFVLRIYWEGQERPSVECPLADFFALPWVARGEEGTHGPLVQVNSLMVSVNPLPYKEVYTILDGVQGRGQYVGTAMGWGINHFGWWGEGEIKFFLDGDGEFRTICGTGTEDYFGGAYDWEVDGQYVPYSTPYLGMHQVLRPDGPYRSQHRHALYRWHVVDPIRFAQDLRVTIQALGWRGEGRYLPGQHDICSVAFWYQTLPAAPSPRCPTATGWK